MAQWPPSAALLSFLVVGSALSAHAAQDSAQIRTRITAVPIDVRVVDRDGRPITDLTAADFVIKEEGVPQQLTQFATLNYQPPGPKEGNGRTFLIVFGRGRLQGVANGLTGVVRFLRSGLLPGDRVAILAYKRVTEFSQDVEPLIRLVETYGKEHSLIEAQLDHFFLNAEVRARIDSLFSNPGLPKVHELPNAYPPSNVGQLFLGIEHLRRLEGEKHLIFLTEDGIHFGQRITSSLAQTASDARVTISPIQTNGTPSRVRQPSARARSGPVRLTARSMSQAFAYADLRRIATETGGVSSAYEYVQETLDRLKVTTSFQYLLGYEPSNDLWDGKHRRIEVTVKRPGAQVLHRNSYFAGPEIPPEERARTFALSRIASAGRRLDAIKDIELTVALGPKSTASEVDLTLIVSGVHTTPFDLAVFCGDEKENVIGELWRTVELNQSTREPNRDGYRTSLRVPIAGALAYVKVVAYERSTDKLGTALLTVR